MFFRTLMVVTLLAALNACSFLPNCELNARAFHLSSPLEGAPLEKQKGSEDHADLVGGALRCTSENGRVFVENTLDWNVYGRNGGGIIGGPLLYTGQFGVKLKEWKR